MINMKFRNKTILLFIPVIIFISLIFTFTAINAERKLLREEILKRGELLASFAAKSSELPILSENADLLAKTSLSLREFKNVAFVCLYNRSFTLLVHNGLVVAPPLRDVSPELAVITLEQQKYFEIYAPVFSERVVDDVEIFGESAANHSTAKEHIGWTRIGLSKDAMVQGEKNIIWSGIIFALLYTSVSILLVSVLINYATKPINSLFQAVVGLKKGEFPRLQTVETTDEIGILSLEFNRMTEAIEDREKKLIESEQKLKSLFERVQHAIFIMDTEYFIVEANRKFKELCGDKPHFFTLLPENRVDSFLATISTGDLINSEETLIGNNDNPVTVLMSIYPECDETGVINRFDGHFIDITENKKIEAALRESQKLDSLGMLAGGVAHDFNNILTGILGFASLLKISTPTTGPGYEFLDTIEKAAQRAANLTRQLLAFARKGKYQNRQIKIDELITELIGFLKETFDRNISISFRTNSTHPLIVMGDSNQLYQTLLNLCINSRDAMPEGGGTITIISEDILLDAPHDQIPAGNYAHILVADTGKGIPPEIKQRIFEPFFTTKGAGKGTGLGLSVVYGIIKNHGGYITVESEPDKGTAFHIYLPIIGERKESPLKAASSFSLDAISTILFADDEPNIRTMVGKTLEAKNQKLLFAVNGLEALTLYRQHKDEIDLVILDMVMPEKSGKEVFREIKKMTPSAKILLCSGYGEDQYFHELFEEGAAGFLQKPFLPLELIDKINEILGKTAVKASAES